MSRSDFLKRVSSSGAGIHQNKRGNFTLPQLHRPLVTSSSTTKKQFNHHIQN